MDTDRSIAVGVLAVFAVGAVAVWRLQPRSEPQPVATWEEVPLETKSPERVYVEKIFNPHELSANPTAVPNHELIAGHEVEAFLQAKGRSAPTLVAAHAMSQDPKYLAELRLLQNSALAQAYLLLLPDAEAAKRLHELAPDNAYADFQFASWLAMDDPPRENVLQWLSETAAKTDYDSYREELEHAIVEGFYFVSGDVREAFRNAGVGTGMILAPAVSELQMRRVTSRVAEVIGEEKDWDKRHELVQDALRLAKLAMEDQSLLRGADPGVLLETSVLAQLSVAEVEDETGASREEIAQDHLTAWDEQREQWERFQRAFDQASPADLDAVYEEYRSHGFDSARDLLLKRVPTQPAPAAQPVSLSTEE